MDVNTPLLRKVLDHVTAHPEEWDQGTYGTQTACGTAMCIAGHAVVMTGYDLAYENGQYGERDADMTTTGEDVAVLAASLLGLPDDDMLFETFIFRPRNTLRMIYREANRLTDGEIAIPDTLPDGS